MYRVPVSYTHLDVYKRQVIVNRVFSFASPVIHPVDMSEIVAWVFAHFMLPLGSLPSFKYYVSPLKKNNNKIKKYKKNS